MPSGIFSYKVNFKQRGSTSLAYAEGEITNNTSKEYNTAVFRLTLHNKSMLAWTGVIKIRGLRARQTKSFEIPLEGIDYKTAFATSRHELYFESGY